MNLQGVAMQLSITTDYAIDKGSPQPYLRRIADAGFTHVHWCHQWNTDFLYSRSEIEQIRRWLREYGLQLLDLHGSKGMEKNWSSLLEYERLAGVELVKNRIRMAARLGGDVVIMHTGLPPEGQEEVFWRSLRRSLDTLQPFARQRGVRIAIENGRWLILSQILADYPADFIGICYDSGHGNLGRVSLDELETVKQRLISVHLHDNDGSGDQHNIPFTGTVQWERLTGIMAASSYQKCISMEATMGSSGIKDEMQFLTLAYAAGTRLSQMIAAQRDGK